MNVNHCQYQLSLVCSTRHVKEHDSQLITNAPMEITVVKIDNYFGLICSDLFPLRSFSSVVDDYDNIIVSFSLT